MVASILPSSSSSASDIATHVLTTLSSAENTPYIGEPVSQLQHALQCAQLAATEPPYVDDETVVAALLHDIGQFVGEEEMRRVGAMEAVKDMVDEGVGSVGRVGHEILSARYLAALGFPGKVCRLVGSHVVAKRYLCAVDKDYYSGLSEASKKSLEFQGGPMAAAERVEFERSSADGEVDDILRLRRWDDRAKVVGKEVQGVQSYRDMMVSILEKARQ